MRPIEIESLSVSYNGRPAVRDFTLAVPEGAWVCLIGPNGSGKTTVLRAVAGLVGGAGQVRLFGADRSRLSRREVARRIALVPQTPVIPPGTLVVDYVLLGRTPYIPFLGAESARDLKVVTEVLEKLDLISFASRPLDSLSGGELQRAVLARALAQQSPVLLLDEPTTGLDVGHQQQVLELVDALRRERGLTILGAMHDLTLAGQFAQELVLLRQGRAVVSGPRQLVLTEETLERHYEASVRVIDDPVAGTVVIPVREAVSEERK